MDVIQSSLQSGDIEIPYYTWPILKPKAVIIFIHGLKSHAGWFLETGAEFASKCVRVYAPDRQGAGRSALPKGDISDYHDWVRDIEAMIALAKSENPQAPIHLLGHCFGARLALVNALRDPDSLASLILMSPPLQSLKVDISLWEKLKTVFTLISGIPFKVRVPINDNMFTCNPEKQLFIANDTLKLDSMTTRCCLAIRSLDHWLNKHLQGLKTPTLCLLAEEDVIVDNERVKWALSHYINQAPTSIATFPCQHQLFFEESSSEVIQRIESWVIASS